MRKFSVICADPCWSFNDKLKMDEVKRGAESQYSVMSYTDISNLPVKQLIDPEGTVLALWVPSSLLEQGLNVLKAWGFQHKQTFIWVKTKKQDSVSKSYAKTKNINDCLSFGMGRLFRQSHEICLIGTSGNGIYKKLKNKSQRSVSLAPNEKHSKKPEDLQDKLELMFPNTNKLELFARRVRKDWTCLGNEVCSGEDIRISIEKLL